MGVWYNVYKYTKKGENMLDYNQNKSFCVLKIYHLLNAGEYINKIELYENLEKF